MNSTVRSLVLLAVALGALAVPVASRAQPARFEAFYLFGDSLADVGNDLILTTGFKLNPPVPPSASPHRTYFQGRFSNGPIAFEYLWWLVSQQAPGRAGGLTAYLASPKFGRNAAVSFAFGGSSSGYLSQTPGKFFVPGLKGQVELFRLALNGKRPSSNALYALITGANDYLVTPPSQPADPADVVANITDAVEKLYLLGARAIMVLNLPDLGLIPLVAGTPESLILSGLSARHNALLAQALTSLANRLPAAKIIPVDLALAFRTLPPGLDLATPALDTLGLPPGASTCLFTNPATCPDVPMFIVDPKYFFWDGEHPTTAAHQLLGRYLYATLQQ